MTRIYIPEPLSGAQIIDLPASAAQHLVQVLRLRAGDAFVCFDGRGGEYPATLVEVSKRSARAELGARVQISRESPLDLRLAQCVSKGERMDFTLQKAVELGVTRITPILSARAVVKLDEDRWSKKLEHWQGVIISACQQSGRTRIPTLVAPVKLDAWLTQQDFGLGVLLDPAAHTSLATLPAPGGAVTLLIGPEGGLADDEIARAQTAGMIGVRMGPRILRTETAGLAALAALQARLGDWQ
ncbi:16S rRNA (uracil(1498)-N(3))-methyltransferase [Sinimarinibacterium sp. NLF-5-8]|uniref:16S rRNA (uracil(1498)-N(3))-methyltransferase n=1 Tax=Sinimarinibacterium sp. NLF-5-8 TaxID=2698684 RepID=UPI00137BAC43|nr:16S rRNA (uracil(1498)-N(3))-methyltransferase [Sinimarinibacterium sp. NLF-5-8]QHS09276.1 16S rRNA (uracil(1498)-N(3))-methyltransferase [Sinimarinibacterium sp. NLF-5-8]